MNSCLTRPPKQIGVKPGNLRQINLKFSSSYKLQLGKSFCNPRDFKLEAEVPSALRSSSD